VHDELPILCTFCGDLACEVIISKEEVITLGDDKKLTYEWAEKNLPHNTIHNVLLSDWTEEWSSDNEQFIKPRKGRGGRGCKVVTKDELVWIKAHTKDTDSYIVMENMPGREWTVDAYVGRDGTQVYAVARERMGLAGGISIKGKTEKNEAVLRVTKTMLDALLCRGPVCIQWKEDARGIPRLIEINPRLSGGLLISVHAGVNPISNIVRENEGEKLDIQAWEEVTVLGYYEYKQSK
jgi:carbamoylphosphate synthase large subunit